MFAHTDKSVLPVHIPYTNEYLKTVVSTNGLDYGSLANIVSMANTRYPVRI